MTIFLLFWLAMCIGFVIGAWWRSLYDEKGG